ncbi:uncharacterized protein B0I36DRAFT_416958 [Microdochium trichocladiopsis]|uniref:Uncharacterized protein n=1 Tax=Microdochium trichocladiopsis TaxID=1682393 RepID=A0A9P9BLK4_9PEZI|nr:uncharacterized protein B0I36DRAFT_416958 [Microdochium trichocladiopsis]KAH7025002.1 hypothetical protein B0I36DRAFT_416958 [Microdochium trichocladiopsis]
MPSSQPIQRNQVADSDGKAQHHRLNAADNAGQLPRRERGLIKPGTVKITTTQSKEVKRSLLTSADRIAKFLNDGPELSRSDDDDDGSQCSLSHELHKPGDSYKEAAQRDQSLVFHKASGLVYKKKSVPRETPAEAFMLPEHTLLPRQHLTTSSPSKTSDATGPATEHNKTSAAHVVAAQPLHKDSGCQLGSSTAADAVRQGTATAPDSVAPRSGQHEDEDGDWVDIQPLSREHFNYVHLTDAKAKGKANTAPATATAAMGDLLLPACEFIVSLRRQNHPGVDQADFLELAREMVAASLSGDQAGVEAGEAALRGLLRST